MLPLKARIHSFLAGLITGMVFGPAANAAEFHLKDGSFVVGDILSLSDGSDLVIDTEHMDEVTIEWDALERVRETRVVEVEFFDGRRILGRLALDSDELTITGNTTIKIDPTAVYSISEVKLTFWDRLEGHTDLGINIVRGNSRVTQSRFGAGVGYDALDFEVAIDATTYLNEQLETEDTRRTTLSALYVKNLDRGWGAIGLYQLESDDQQNLDSRSLLGGAVGRRVLNSRAQRLELFAGLAFNSEDFAQASDEESVEGLLGTRYRLRSGMDIDATMILFPNTEQSGRYRVQFDASSNTDLIADLDFNLTVYQRYDSEPPSGNDKNDYGLTLGLRWEY